MHEKCISKRCTEFFNKIVFTFPGIYIMQNTMGGGGGEEGGEERNEEAAEEEEEDR